jgi:hypothetical protein
MADTGPAKRPQSEPDFSGLDDAVVDTTPPWQIPGTPAAGPTYQGPTYSSSTTTNDNARSHRVVAERSAAKRNLIFGVILLVVGVLLAMYSFDAGANEIAASRKGVGRLATGAIGGGLYFLFRAFFRLDRR